MWSDTLLAAERSHLIRVVIWAVTSAVLGTTVVMIIAGRRMSAPIALWFATWFAASRKLIAREREVREAIGRVAHAHARVLAGSGVIVAALVLVGWDRPSPRVVFGVLALLVIWEVGLRVLARAPGSGRVGPAT